VVTVIHLLASLFADSPWSISTWMLFSFCTLFHFLVPFLRYLLPKLEMEHTSVEANQRVRLALKIALEYEHTKWKHYP